MRLLVVTQKVDIGDDVMSFFHNWLLKLAPLVDELHVIGNATGKYDLPSNVHIYSLGREKGKSRIMRVIRLNLLALRILPRVDGIFIHMCPEYVAALYPLNLFFKKPVVMWYAHIGVSKTAKWAVAHVDKILSPSKDSFLHDTDKVIPTGHGIDPDIFSPVSREGKPERKKLLVLGRISYVKDLDTLVEAINILVHERKRVNIEVIMVGSPARAEDDKYLAHLREKISKYGIEHYFTWMGSVANNEAVEYYRNSDLFIRTQKGGGYGKVELEAMATGLRVVLPTDVYNKLLPEFAKDMYFTEQDSAMLAEKIDKVLNWDDVRKARYAARVRRLVIENHNLNKLAIKIVDSFNERES
jgi:glycosyltransferase involved in cell wall biosynthesis